MYFNNNHYIEICKNIFTNKMLTLSEYKQIEIYIKYFQEISKTTNLMTWLQWAHIGVRFPAGMCSARCTNVSWSLGWGCPTEEVAGPTAPEEAALFEILPV